MIRALDIWQTVVFDALGFWMVPSNSSCMEISVPIAASNPSGLLLSRRARDVYLIVDAFSTWYGEPRDRLVHHFDVDGDVRDAFIAVITANAHQTAMEFIKRYLPIAAQYELGYILWPATKHKRLR